MILVHKDTGGTHALWSMRCVIIIIIIQIMQTMAQKKGDSKFAVKSLLYNASCR